MTKRIISLLLASAMLLSMTSCSKKEKKIAYQEGMTLEEYIDKVELPENLTISIDPTTVTDQTTVYTYDQVEFMSFDAETLKEYFLQNPITEEETIINGISLISETDNLWESLLVYDGGTAYSGQIEHTGNGGFSYETRPSSNCDRAWKQVGFTADLDVTSATMSETGLLSEKYHIGETILDFATREEITDLALSFFQTFQIPNITTQQVMGYNLDYLNEQYDIDEQAFIEDYEYNLIHDPEWAATMPKTYFEYMGIYEPQKSDEMYNISCCQSVDEIRIDTHYADITVLDDSESPWRTPEIQLQYTEQGVVRAHLLNVIQPPSQKEGTETEILSASAALEKVRESYGQGILLEPHEIESLELVYRLYWSDEEKVASLKPFWLARVSYPIEAEIITSYFDETAPTVEKEIKVYDYIYFDAITGEYWEGSTSAKPV